MASTFPLSSTLHNQWIQNKMCLDMKRLQFFISQQRRKKQTHWISFCYNNERDWNYHHMIVQLKESINVLKVLFEESYEYIFTLIIHLDMITTCLWPVDSNRNAMNTGYCRVQQKCVTQREKTLLTLAHFIINTNWRSERSNQWNTWIVTLVHFIYQMKRKKQNVWIRYQVIRKRKITPNHNWKI